jgi:hypothetical protein
LTESKNWVGLKKNKIEKNSSQGLIWALGNAFEFDAQRLTAGLVH